MFRVGRRWATLIARRTCTGSRSGGVISRTGIAGLTLGGGVGWLVRKHGLTCDNVLSFEVVTAEGKLVTASAAENPDLFWALRGGGGNFGVVTSFEFRVHPVSIVLGGMIIHPRDKAVEVLRFYRQFVDGPGGTDIVCLMHTRRRSGDRNRRVLLRRSRHGRRVDQAAAGLRDAAGRRVSTDAISGFADDDRCRVPGWKSQLLEIHVPAWTDRRSDCGDGRARESRGFTLDRDDHRIIRRRRGPGGAGRDGLRTTSALNPDILAQSSKYERLRTPRCVDARVRRSGHALPDGRVSAELPRR